MKENQGSKEQRRKNEGARTKERTRYERDRIQMNEGGNDPSPCLDVVLTSLTAISSKASIAHTLARLAITMSANFCPDVVVAPDGGKAGVNEEGEKEAKEAVDARA